MASEAHESGNDSAASGAEGPPNGRRSRQILILGVVIVVAVVAGLTVWTTRRAPETGDTSGGLTASAPVEFDLGRQLLRLGDLPGPVRTATYTIRPDLHKLEISGALTDASPSRGDHLSSDYAWQVEILMATRGADVHSFVPYDEDSGPAVIPRERVAPVHGRRAVQALSDQNRVLAWEYAPDAEIRMMLSTASTAERRDEMARQVAEGVRWETTPRALPFEVDGLPDGAVRKSTYLRWEADGPVVVSADYLVAPVENEHDYPGPVITIGIDTSSLGSAAGSDDVTVSGRRATARESRGSGTVGIYRVAQLPGGCAECVAELVIAPAATAAIGDRDDALRLAASIRLVKGHEDPTRWRFW
ncbi:hypothetical protein SAMN05216284_104296 [Micromonospora sediminimaris]|uniref:Uncharacterized protein n=1 Tax=Micromonospora sediminimaris TaxID=547162 RepID=A0A9W5UM72_9ACTN|nr:hypothetical protein Vse01_04990 [Micromonospora sediminimaris]SFC43464.1 hypothetical protein SAMN05216284_104296 [Micromonospora sediminimaris]